MDLELQEFEITDSDVLLARHPFANKSHLFPPEINAGINQTSLAGLQVVLIENKEESLLRAQSRSAELGLKNIGFIQANLDYFTGAFHVGVSGAKKPSLFVHRHLTVLKIEIIRIKVSINVFPVSENGLFNDGESQLKL